MSFRADKSDAQLWRPARSGHHRGNSGRKGGGGGNALLTSQSFKKSGSGQEPEEKVNPIGSSSESNAIAGTYHVDQNGRNPHDGLESSSGKPPDVGNSRDLPTTLTSQPATAPKTAPKADVPMSFPLQFGSFGETNHGLIKDGQIPVRTSSAPPNLDDQKCNQAYHDPSKALLTAPVPTAPKQQQHQTRKDLGANPSYNGECHRPTETKRDGHVSGPPTPTIAEQRSSVIPIDAVPRPMPSQQSQVPLQFSSSFQMQSQVALRLGNAPRASQQMFIPVIHPRPLQPQGIMQQGQALGFRPPIDHQLPRQISNLGNLIPTQYPQQQTGKIDGPGLRKTTVKITHPETHEELRLDSYADGSTSGQRHLSNVTPQSQPIPAFASPHQFSHYPPMQLNPYSAHPPFFPTSFPPTNAQMNIGPQNPSYGYPVSQGVHAIPFMNQHGFNFIPGSIPGPSPLLHSVPGPVQVTVMPPVSRYAEKCGPPSVTIGAPISKAEFSATPTASISKANPSVSITAPISKTKPSVTISAPISKAEAPVTIPTHISKAESSVTVTTPVNKAELSHTINMLVGNTEASPGQKQEILTAVEHGKAEASYDSSVDSRDAKVHPVSTITESSFVKENEVEEGNSEKVISCELSDCDKQRPVTHNEVIGSSFEVDRTAGESDLCATASSDFSDTDAVPSTSTTVALGDESEGIPIVLSGTKDKSSLEPRKTKPAGGRKKRRKEILSKADASVASDLYNAYKGPEQKQETASTSESMDSSVTVDLKHTPVDVSDKEAVADEGNGRRKGEFADWEDAADISTPKLKASENGSQVYGGRKIDEVTNKKKYLRDFLLTFAEQCPDLPVGFEIRDIADVLMSVPAGASRGPHPNHGRITDRSSGGSRGDRRMGGTMGDGKWIKPPGTFGSGVDVVHGHGVNHGVLRNPRGQPSNQFVGGIFSGATQSPASHGGIPLDNANADRWQRATGFQKGLVPSPQTPLQVMHKAEKKYEVGKVSDQEQAKHRQIKAILNKLTPQNFEKLFEQVKEVNIDSATTLNDVISQIFDKALMEPTFCEMYADFCFHLDGNLPDFVEDNEKITFRRLLLTKCQEEFEKGESEQAEADNVEVEGDIKQSENKREAKRLCARRRMLGNIRLIGELYKKKILTEKIMHACIRKLLGMEQNPDQKNIEALQQNPDEEDIEALCKLMATIGEMIDHIRARTAMDSYFRTMSYLSIDEKLSSRVRFMLRDVIDLRKNNWQERRKVDGPKKIAQVHRDAVQERQAQATRLSRGPGIGSSGRRGPPGDYALRGSTVQPSPSSQLTGSIRSLPPQNRGYVQDARVENRHQGQSRTSSVPLPHRNIGGDSITLGPQGGLARGMSIRGQPLILNFPSAEIHPSSSDPRRMPLGSNGYCSVPGRPPYNSREEMPRDGISGDRDHAGRIPGPLSSRPCTPELKPLSEGALTEKSISAIREFYSAKDEKEIALCVKELNSPSFYPSMVSLWVMDSFERKDLERDLLSRLLVKLCKPCDSLLSNIQLIQGFKSVLDLLEDAVNDAPKAPEFLGSIFATIILDEVVSLKEIGRLIREAGEEPGSLLEIGLAADVLGSILESIRRQKGASIMNEILTNSNLQLQDFQPPHLVKSNKLAAFL